MSYTTLSTKTDDAVMTVTLNNGETNLLSAVMAGELFALVGELSMTPAIKVVVFESSNADFFIAHFDLNDILKTLSGDPSVPVSKFPDINILQSLSLSIQALPQVTIAKVDGVCRGGGFELILAMDMTFATEKARFCFPEASVGFLPAGGGATFLPLKAGRGRALEVMLSGRDFNGTEAEQYSFVNLALSDTAALNEYVDDLASRIGSNDAAAIGAVKETINKTSEGFIDGVMAGLAQENESMIACLSDPKVLEAIQLMAANSGTRATELDLPDNIRAFK